MARGHKGSPDSRRAGAARLTARKVREAYREGARTRRPRRGNPGLPTSSDQRCARTTARVVVASGASPPCRAAALATGRPLSYLDGMDLSFRSDRRAKLLPLQVTAPDIEEWLLARDPEAIGSWREMGMEEYARAFTAAQTAGFDVIDDLYFGLIDNIARGGTEADFAKLVTPILTEKGWLGGDADAIGNRVRLIYDTNLRLARASGRWTHYQAGKQAAPYLRAFTVGDERVRHPPKSPKSDHRAWDGIILPIDHPFWTEYFPPLGFRCRCSVVQMTRSELARRKDGVTSESDLAERRERLGPPVFLSPAMPIEAQLSAIAAATNDGERMPGMPRVDTVATAKAGGDAFDAVLRASSLKDIGRQLAAMGL